MAWKLYVISTTPQTLGNEAPAKSKFMKSGCVSGAKMLPRSEMQKIPRDCYGGEAKFTQVQELKQALFVKQ